MSIQSCKDLGDAVHSALLQRYLFGDKRLIDLFLIAFLCRGHILLEGPPGTGKTLAAKLLAHLLAKKFKRIQFTSDMLPSDIIGAHIYSPAKQGFDFIQGPLFSELILADEINRTPPRTQSALLEGMEERQVTAEGESFLLSPDFFVVATQNPQDFEGTFPLPEAQTDRFLFKVRLGHSSAEVETEMLQAILSGTLPPVFDELPRLDFNRRAIDLEIQALFIDKSIVEYTSRILQQTRKSPALRWGSSVRGGIALLKSARIYALLDGRTHVTPDDVKAMLVPTLEHRIKLTPEAQLSGTPESEVLQQIAASVEFPR